jgi:hypothetical protein
MVIEKNALQWMQLHSMGSQSLKHPLHMFVMLLHHNTKDDGVIYITLNIIQL